MATVTAQRVKELLLQRARARKVGAIAQMTLGLLLTALVPLGLAMLMVFNGEGRMRIPGDHTDWLVGLGIFGFIMAIAYGMEWRYRGTYLMRRLNEIGKGGMWDTLNERHWRYEQREGAAAMELWLYIPRQVFEGCGKLKGMGMVASADLDRAALVIVKMLESQHRVEVESLRTIGAAGQGDGLAFGKTMAYLLLFDWVAAGEDGQHVWIGTDSRSEIQGGGVSR